DRPEVALAERACGETDRLDPPGMPRSRRCLRRGPSAPDPCDLRRLLQRVPNAPVTGQGFAVPSPDPTAPPSRCSAAPPRTASSLLSDLVSGRNNPAAITGTHTSLRFARMHGTDPNSHPTRRCARHDVLSDMLDQLLLNLEPPGKMIHDTIIFRQSDDPPRR